MVLAVAAACQCGEDDSKIIENLDANILSIIFGFILFVFLLQGVKMSYVGKSKTRWTEGSKHKKTYYLKEKYFEEKIIIVGKCKLIMKIQVNKVKILNQ